MKLDTTTMIGNFRKEMKGKVGAKVAHSISSWFTLTPVVMIVLLLGCDSKDQDKGRAITYRVEGAATVTIEYWDGGDFVFRYDVELPWSHSFEVETLGWLMCVGAETSSPKSEYAAILIVSIYVDGELVSSEIRQGRASTCFQPEDNDVS